MALTVASGVDGSFTTVTGHAAKFDTWKLTGGQRLINITGFDSAGFEENIGGLKYGRWEATGFARYGTAATSTGIQNMSKVGGTATFQVATGCTESATCIVENVEIMQDVNGASRLKFSGVTSGTITEVWALT